MTVPVMQARLDHKENWNVFFIMPKNIHQKVYLRQILFIKLKELKDKGCLTQDLTKILIKRFSCLTRGFCSKVIWRLCTQ